MESRDKAKTRNAHGTRRKTEAQGQKINSKSTHKDERTRSGTTFQGKKEAGEREGGLGLFRFRFRFKFRLNVKG